MAGIGIQFQKILNRNNYYSTAKAYSFAALVGIGPWVISVFGLLFVDLISLIKHGFDPTIVKFQISAVYLIACSIIFSSFGQQNFSRYIADVVFAKHNEKIFPNYMGLVFVLTLVGGLLGYPLSFYIFSHHSFYYQVLMAANFIMLSNIWVSACLLTSLKNYKPVLVAFLIGYLLVIVAAFYLRTFGVDGLLAAFLFGQFIVLFGVIIALFYNYPSNDLLGFEFLRHDKIFYTLVFASLFFNLGVWSDKFIFWLSPITGTDIFPPLRASIVYDIPMFLAYLCMLPGITVCLMHIETKFFRYYGKYYDEIREGYTLFDIMDMRFHMINAARFTLFEVLKLQGLLCVAVFIFARKIFAIFGLSRYYSYLLNIDVVATSLLVILIAILYIFNYFDRRKELLYFSILLFVLNVALTIVTQFLGVGYYGYGFAIAIFITLSLALFRLSYFINNLEFMTFTE